MEDQQQANNDLLSIKISAPLSDDVNKEIARSVDKPCDLTKPFVFAKVSQTSPFHMS
jgi:hypothetical protein